MKQPQNALNDKEGGEILHEEDEERKVSDSVADIEALKDPEGKLEVPPQPPKNSAS